MSLPRRSWRTARVERRALGVLFGFLFLAGFLFFLISACSQKKPTAVKPNQPPTLALVPNQTTRSVDEDQSLGFALVAVDPEGAVPTLSALGLPKNSVFVDSANGRGSFAWTPAFSQAGNYLFRFIASDGRLADTVRVAVFVGNVNRPPYLLPIDSQFFVEGSLRAFGLRGIDPDGDSIFLSADSIPPGAFFIDSTLFGRNGRGGFFWSPDFNQSGQYFPIFSVTDRQYSASARPKLVVLDFDRAPSIAPVAGQRVTEGQVLSFSVSATDPDGDPIALSAFGLPAGAAFFDSSNGRGGLRWQTRVLEADTFFDTAVFIVAASRALADTLRVPIQVDTALLTYTNNTKPIFDGNCRPCHFPGGIECPPYCWNTYSGVFAGKDIIRIQVINGTMPPGGAGLPQGKRDTINAWVLRGAPQ